MIAGCKERLDKAKRAFRDADKLVIGAGAGLSSASGIEYNGKRFTENFKPFIEKYGMNDLYTSSFIRSKPRRRNGLTGLNISV
jgi:NAD-dependent SIR2 family protein deacetylase